MSNNEKRVISKSVVSILLGLNFILFVISTVIPGINNQNFFTLLATDTANIAIRVVVLVLFASSFIFTLVSIVKYIKDNELYFYGCFAFNIIVSLIILILNHHFTIFTAGIKALFYVSMAVMVAGFIYFVYLAKKDYQCLFGITLSEDGEILYDDEIESSKEVPVEINQEQNNEETNEDNIVSQEETIEVPVETPAEEVKEEKTEDFKVEEETIEDEPKENDVKEEKVETKSKKKISKPKKEVKKEVKKKVESKKPVTSKKDNKSNSKTKKKSGKKTSLFAKKTPVISQELTKEDLVNDKDAKEEFTKEVKNDISEAADKKDIPVGVARKRDCKKYFVTLVISIVLLIGSFFAPIFIGEKSSLYPYQEFSASKSYFTLALTIVYAIIVVGVLFSFGWLVIRRKERDNFEDRVNSITKFIFGFSIIYFVFGLVYFLIKMFKDGDKGTTYTFIFPILMIVILIFNAIIKSKYQKDVLFVDTKSSIDYSDPSFDYEDSREVKALTRPFPSVGLLFADILFTTLPIIVLFVDLFKVSATGMETKTIKAIDYILKMSTFTEASSLAISFVLIVLGSIVAILFLCYFITYFGKQRKFYAISTANIVTCTIIVSLITLYGLYYKMVQASNKSEIVLLIESFFPGVDKSILEAISAFKVDTKSYIIFLVAVGLLLFVLIANPMKNAMIYDELDDRKLLEARLNATPINGETLGEFIDNRLDTIPSGNEENPQDQNQEEQPAEVTAEGEVIENAAPEGEAPEEKVEILEDFDACPAFTELDSKVDDYNFVLDKRNKMKFENLDLVKLSHFIINYAANSRLHLSYKYEDIAAFIAGLGCAKLTILQGMSGTGKTSLPKIFMEAIFGNCEIIEIESSWREKNELLGFYNEFSKMYTPKKFTQCLYKATLNQDVVTFIVLDEMNLSRIEYYFSDFLSLMENEEDKREIKLSNVKLYNIYDNERHSYISLKEDHTLKVPANVWFIGTANRDESTFEISDKVYDRAHTMNFNKRAPAIDKYGPEMKPKFMDYNSFKSILETAKKSYKFDIEKNDTIKKVEQLLIPFNISFGNRIYRQIIDFVKVYCSCYSDPKKVEFDAVETILLTKVVMKLENKNIENKELLVHEFEKLKLKRCAEFISKLSED